MTTPDAPQPDAPIDTPPVFTACLEFGAITATVPAHVSGMLANADVESPSTCDTVDAPYGIESAGPDAVIRIDGLIPGNAYDVRLESSEDLSFYVASGCSTPSGPSAAECQLFEDATAGGVEVGRFVARSTTTYVIVDYYASHTPASQAFTLDVYAEACNSSTQCTSSLPVCLNGVCVECATSFDCTSPAASVCNTTTSTCAAGVDQCDSDGSAEPANDGPAGAAPLTLDATGSTQVAGLICSRPRGEADFFSFQVTTLGDTWDFALGWSGARDLDLEVFDAKGTAIGYSYWEDPERIRLTYLPTGTYYIRVSDYSATTSVPVQYQLAAQRTAGTACTTRAQCATEYRNQIYRGNCTGGACVPIDGAGLVAELGACDSISDCATGLSCASFFFVANADTRDVCARVCTTDTDCAPLGSNYVCTNYLTKNHCVQKCTSDVQCPTSLSAQPTSGPWYRLTCQLSTGRCVP